MLGRVRSNAWVYYSNIDIPKKEVHSENMSKQDPQDYKKKCYEHYQSLVSIYSPVLKARITFNSDGFYHMIFKSSRRRRKRNDQYNRLALIPLIKPVIQTATRIDEVRIEEEATLKGQKIVSYHALVATVSQKNCRVKVVVRKLENGEYHFHSVMKL